ncbi:MAG: DUF4870 domain-containing protein [Patescibacteria group bacterium]
MKDKISFDPKDIEENKAVAALSYLWILCLVPLLVKRDSPFAQAHAKQGLALFIIEIIGSLIFWIPLIGWLLWLIVAIVSLIALVKTLQGGYWEIPGIKAILEKINL